MKYTIIKTSILILVIFAFAPACMSQFDILIGSSDYEKKYQAAFEYFNKEKYEKAAQ